jgi:hypothetical protein
MVAADPVESLRLMEGDGEQGCGFDAFAGADESLPMIRTKSVAPRKQCECERVPGDVGETAP